MSNQNVMAKSTYISENLTSKQIDFMLMLDDYEMDIFSLAGIKELLGDKVDDINELVENLVHKEILSRIERGKYCRHNFRDEKVIGSFLVPDGTVGYCSGLHHHGLTEQFPNTLFIQTTHAKQDKEVFGVYYKFIRIKKSKQTGIVTEGYGNHIYRITSVEKTMADCFDLPRYSGGYAELIRAFHNATLENKPLISACRAINNTAVIKRMGYLAEFYDKKDLRPFIQFAKKLVKDRYNLFDPAGQEEGEFVSEWKLRLNIPVEDLIGIVEKHY